LVCYIRKYVIILGDIPVDVPPTKILGGNVSPASPAGVTPVHVPLTTMTVTAVRYHSKRCCQSYAAAAAACSRTSTIAAVNTNIHTLSAHTTGSLQIQPNQFPRGFQEIARSDFFLIPEDFLRDNWQAIRYQNVGKSESGSVQETKLAYVSFWAHRNTVHRIIPYLI